jgi:hypothetical protein
MPEFCPAKYWDLYDPKSLTLAANPRAPTNTPQIAVQTSQLWRNWLNLSSQSGECMTSFEAWNSSQARQPWAVMSFVHRPAYFLSEHLMKYTG